MKAAFQFKVLLLGATMVAIPALANLNPYRDVLWVALQGCLLTNKTTGRAFPCLAVDLGDKERPGTAVLRAPGQPTHTVVMPTAPVAGLEAPQLQQAAGNVYWKAALAARSYVLSALGGRLPVEQIGVAVNAENGRTQDQLHIHLDCIKPTVEAALRRYAPHLRATWTAFAVRLEWSYFMARRIDAAEVDSFNPFAALMQLPGRNPDLRTTSFAVFAASPDDPNKGYYMLAYQAPKAHAEMLLDHGCATAPAPTPR
ncbi:CDP-diacylglycerol diphosphatase [Methylobacterium sp. Leaf111]|uniref:CDP-diacylglycerol diphosphatase n=1 Tax=Methylobacterium sp. Leaf111 TaxID=1736257 RepID=UPI000ADE6AD5|nr:CDP-diacylglycerol diphosphatase [Methylobacterium sp. Leaf111]